MSLRHTTPSTTENTTSLDPKNVLLLTNHLYEWAGSETIIVELIEAYGANGARVTVFANDIGDEFANEVTRSGCRIVHDAADIELSEFDFIYCQHQVITRFLDQLLGLGDLERPRVVYAHLSPYEPLEFPGPVIEPHFADLIVHNSAETGAALKDLGLKQDRLLLMPNPAPDVFFDVAERDGPLKRLLVVSNHLPAELSAALRRLRKDGIKVTRRGIETRNARITPRDLSEHDAVVSIGKTVQYALAAGRPVYVYDRFGGPGWLTPQNLDDSSWHNFSGRCCRRKLSPAKLASEISAGFSHSQSYRRDLKRAAEKFRLSTWLELELFPAVQARADLRRRAPREIDEGIVQAMRRERVMHLLAVDNRRNARRTQLLDGFVPRSLRDSVFAYRILYFLSRVGPKASRRGFRIIYNALRVNRRKNG